MMDVDEVKKIVVEVIEEIQEISGREKEPIDGGMCPIGGLTGFDSYNALEATAAIAARFNIEIPEKVCLLIAEEECPRALTIDEITSLLCGYLKNAGK